MGNLKRFSVAIAVLLGAIALPEPANANRPAVTGLRITTAGPATRVVISLTERIDYRVFALAAPARMVLDTPELAWAVGASEAARPRGLVAGVRFGSFERGATRIVFDLSGPARVREVDFIDARGGSGHELAFDLEPVSEEAFGRELKRVLAPAAVVSDSPDRLALRMPAPLPKPRESRPLVVIDAGHGGSDPGAISVTGEREKDITLAVARELKRRLQASGRYRVAMTREHDATLRLLDRVTIARRAGADLLLSIHADTHVARDTQGVSVYTLSDTASDAETAAYAQRENKADMVAGVVLADERPEVASILLDLARRETGNLSSEFAGLLVSELGRAARLVPNPHRFAGFIVLKAPDVPSVLVELGYLSNPEDERLLRQSGHQGRLADAIARAVDRYFAHMAKLARS